MISTAIRAERLRVLYAVCRSRPYVDPNDVLDEMDEGEVIVFANAEPVDLALLNACLELEVELRERAFAAAERLCELVGAGEGALDERIRALPERERIPALAATLDLEWVDR